ncbi:MAG: hypothetical protein ACRC0G_16930 [Fusobacteriaceae bacterium]
MEKIKSLIDEQFIEIARKGAFNHFPYNERIDSAFKRTQHFKIAKHFFNNVSHENESRKSDERVNSVLFEISKGETNFIKLCKIFNPETQNHFDEKIPKMKYTTNREFTEQLNLVACGSELFAFLPKISGTKHLEATLIEYFGFELKKVKQLKILTKTTNKF